MAFKITLSPEVMDHLKAFRAHERVRIFDEIERQLLHQPNVVTQNRKHMRPNRLAEWELRVGDFRVYYTVWKEEVSIHAVGFKVGAKVFIGGKEWIL